MKKIPLHVEVMKTTAADYGCDLCPEKPWCQGGIETTLGSLLGLLGLG